MSEPSWSKAPAQRTLSVEAVMDVASAILSPEPDHKDVAELDNVDLARAREYSLLAALLARAPDAAMLGRIGKLRGDETPLGQAHLALGRAANRANTQTIEREFFNLFIGIGRGELLPYSSYYLTGFLNERPLARLREDLAALGIERSEGRVEPEDHASIFCEMMAGLSTVSSPLPWRSNSGFLKNILFRGSAVFSPISNRRRQLIFTAMWGRSADYFWRLKQSIRVAKMRGRAGR